MDDQGFLVRNGLAQSGFAIVLALVVAALIVTPSSGQSEIAGRLAVIGLALFVVTLAIGSPRLIGLTTVPVLGGALLASASAAEPAWIRSIVIGSLWFLAVEIAWEAVERRDGADRKSAYDNRRINELAMVTTLSVGVTTLGFLLSAVAPTRTLFVIGIVVLGLLLALSLATRRVIAEGTSPDQHVDGV